MIVCVCNAVNDRAIRRAVADGHDTLDDLQFELGVGNRCGKCVATVCEVLFETRLEALQQQADAIVTVAPSPVHPLRFVERPSTRPVALA